MFPDRTNLERMITSLESAMLSALQLAPDERDFRRALEGAVLAILLESGDDRKWVLEQLDAMLARHGIDRVSW